MWSCLHNSNSRTSSNMITMTVQQTHKNACQHLKPGAGCIARGHKQLWLVFAR
jgi:hypothetical protein